MNLKPGFKNILLLGFLLPAILPGAEKLSVIRRPIINLPAIVQPAQSFDIICEAPKNTLAWTALLITPGKAENLTISSSTFDAASGRWTLSAEVPAGAGAAFYDLIIAAGGGIADTSANAVKVIDSPKTSYTVIHISDTHFDRRANIDYNTVPEFLKIAREINLINPEFVLHSGDLVDEATLERYYEVAQEALNTLEVPIWVAPGGSDVEIFQSNSQDTQYWNAYFGDIMDFSFRYGNHLFAGLQEWEFPGESFSRAQLDWLGGEYGAQDAMRVLFYHYDLQNQLDAAYADANAIDLLLYGHLNKNRDETIGSGTRNIGTAATMHGGYGQYTYSGEYRILQFENDQLIDTEVIQYNNLNLSYSPVNNGSNPEIYAEIENKLLRNFSGARLRFYVPESYSPYTVSNGTLVEERATGTGVAIVIVETDLIANSNKTVHLEPAAGLANHPPRIATTSPEQTYSITVGQTQSFSATAIDDDNDQLAFSWKINDVDDSETSGTLAFTANSTHIGLNTIEVTVSDGTFADIYQWTVTVVELSSDYAIIAHPFNLVGPDENAQVTWDEVISLDCYFRFGTQPGNYNLGAVPEDGISKSASFVPSNVGLSAAGIYYGIITNSADATIAADEYKSTEFPVIIESQSTAEVIAPKGTITDQTPTLQWQAVDGVPYYHILVSDNRITITEDENGETIVQGANIIWQAITPGTTIRYGDTDPADYFNESNGTAPPLMSGLTYNFMVLNNYGNHPAFTSSVQPSVNEFVVDVPSALSPPLLSNPADNALISGDNITFQWDAVTGAINYKISIFEERQESGSTVSFLVWETTTSNTLVDFPAGNFLINSDYTWKVLAWDEAGGGIQSSNFHFNYATSVGTMDVTTRSQNGNILPRAELRFTAVSGSSDLIPLLTDDSGWGSKVLRQGTYDVSGSKEGYENTIVQVDLPEDIDLNSSAGNYAVTIYLSESPGNISGRVYDTSSNSGIAAATITADHTTDGTHKEVATDVEGNFIIGVTSGNWDIQAKKSGYLNSSIVTVSISAGSSVNLGQTALGLTFESGTLSGVVRNSNGAGILGATLRAYDQSDTVTTTTTGNGSYSFNLTAKAWTVLTEKTGYVSPQPQSVTVPNGGSMSADFELIPRANMVTGYVTDGSRALAGVTVSATPEAGSPVNSTTNNLGQYSLSLGSGTFLIEATKSGYNSGSGVQVSLSVGETTSGVDFVISPNPSSISGRVTIDGTNSVAGAVVTNGTVSASTSSSGNFTLSLPEGEHGIYATKDGYATSERQVLTLSPGQSLANLDLRISPNAATISGSVTGSGLALYQATITATGDAGTFQTSADAQGLYSISLQPGTYSIVAGKSGYLDQAAQSVTANPGQSVPTIDFSLVLNKGTVKGIAQSPAGDLLRNVIITATDAGNNANQASTTTNISGEYTLKLTGGLSWSLDAAKAGYSGDGAAAAVLEAATARIEDFILTALPSSVAGTVRDESGNGIENVVIQSRSDSVLTNHLGEFTLFLPSGDHNLSATKTGYAGKNVALSLSPGQNLTGVNYTLNSLFGSFSGMVIAAGSPVDGAVVNLSGAVGSATASTNVQGNFTFARLIPGSYSMLITRTGFQPKDSSIILAENENATADIELKVITGAISGAVQSDGQSLPGVTVQASGNGKTFTAITNSNGQFTLNGLPQSAYKISAALTGYTSPSVLENVVPDSSGLTITLIANKARLAGFVKNGDVGLEAAQIILQGQNGNTGQGQTGVDGNFSIENLAADSYSLTAVKEGYLIGDSSLGVVLTPGAQDSVVILLNPTNLAISGRVFANGVARGNTPVQLRGGSEVVNKMTDEQGNFSFGGLKPNATYTVATHIFKEGYSEDDSTLTILRQNIGGIQLNVTVAAGEIFGNVVVNSASVTAQSGDGSTYSTVSGSDGSYRIAQLPAGNYTVAASKSGYQSSPATRSVSVPEIGEVQANFTLSPNVGSITGTVQDKTGDMLKGVQISAVAEGYKPFQTSTDANGQFTFSVLPAGKSYTVAAVLTGFIADPVQQTVNVAKGEMSSANFIMLKKEGRIEGTVSSKGSGAKLANVLVSLQDVQTHQGWNTTTDAGGVYVFENLSPGRYTLNLAKGGYTAVQADSLIELTAGDVLNVQLQMESQSGSLRGFVNYRGRGAQGSIITVSGLSEFSTKTDAQGAFNFKEIPAGVYSVSAAKTGFPAISLPDIKVSKGSDNFLPLDFPGARLQVIFDDGHNPVKNVRVTINAPASQAVLITESGKELFRGEIRDETGSAIISVSDDFGTIATDSLRLAGDYQLTLEKAGYLLPKAQFLTFNVGIDEFKNVSVPLVFQHQPVREANARDSVAIVLNFSGDSVAAVKNPQLWVKRIGAESFAVKAMTRDGNSFRAAIAPHSQSGIAAYFISAQYTAGDSFWDYESPVQLLDLVARDVLYTIQADPYQGILQTGARTKIIGNPVDDTGKSLRSLILASGSFNWQLISPDSSAILQTDVENPFLAYLWPQIDDKIKLSATSTLEGITRSKTYTFTSKTMELERIDIQAPATASNTEAIRLNFFATNTDSVPMRIDSEWQVSPAAAGTVSEDGLFIPSANFMGDAVVSLIDLTSAKKQSAVINLYSAIDSTTETTLVDGQGFALTIHKNAVTRRRQISLYKPRLPEVKKFTKAYQVKSEVYQLLPAGLQFQTFPKVELPVTRDVMKEKASLGWWEQQQLQWQPLHSQIGDSSLSAFVQIFAQIAVLQENEPLGIHGLSFLPRVFSPNRGLLRIGYSLSGKNGQAFVTIRIYNLAGDLVRTLVERQRQYPGVHTEKSIAWDGRTDDNKMARNGRYLVEIIAEDNLSSTRKLSTIVLVK